MIKVTIRLVDGGLSEYNADERILTELRELQDEGFSGKNLINKLITDDWGPPPIIVTLTGKTSSGEIVNERLIYMIDINSKL